jgi:hypothetical protein
MRRLITTLQRRGGRLLPHPYPHVAVWLGQVSQAHTLLLQGLGIGADVSGHAEFLQHMLEFGTELLRRDLHVVSPTILHGWLFTWHMLPV